jgi:uncharacterized protein (TIGR02996 family)
VNDDQAAFLRAIREQPDCDTVRLVYADWLDEHGQAERAEFIRLECEVAHFLKEWQHRDACRCDGGNNRCTPCRDDDKWAEFSKRQWQLFDILHDDFQLPKTPHKKGLGRDFNLLLNVTLYFNEPLNHSTLVQRRGFIEKSICPIDWWLSHGPDLVKWHPVQRVEVTNNIILPSDHKEGWCMIYESATDRDVFKHLWGEGYYFNEDTSSRRLHFRRQQAAENSLSDGLIAWALERLESDQPNFLATSAAVSASSGA